MAGLIVGKRKAKREPACASCWLMMAMITMTRLATVPACPAAPQPGGGVHRPSVEKCFFLRSTRLQGRDFPPSIAKTHKASM